MLVVVSALCLPFGVKKILDCTHLLWVFGSYLHVFRICAAAWLTLNTVYDDTESMNYTFSSCSHVLTRNGACRGCFPAFPLWVWPRFWYRVSDSGGHGGWSKPSTERRGVTGCPAHCPTGRPSGWVLASFRQPLKRSRSLKWLECFLSVFCCRRYCWKVWVFPPSVII